MKYVNMAVVAGTLLASGMLLAQEHDQKSLCRPLQVVDNKPVCRIYGWYREATADGRVVWGSIDLRIVKGQDGKDYCGGLPVCE